MLFRAESEHFFLLAYVEAVSVEYSNPDSVNTGGILPGNKVNGT
jgi:hypothetical protein